MTDRCTELKAREKLKAKPGNASKIAKAVTGSSVKDAKVPNPNVDQGLTL